MLLSELFKPEPAHKTLHGYKIMSLSQFVHAKLYEAILPVEDNQIEDVSTDTEEISNDIIIKNEFDEETKGKVKKLGFLKRDPRAKERRKFGLKKARKDQTYRKR